MKYLFLDTNIYLHYFDIEQINWIDIIEDTEFAIVVPRIVIREIDHHKDQSRGKIQKRAKNVSAKFSQAFLDNVCSKYQLIDCKDPANSYFDGSKFNININDDWIILSAIHSGYEYSDIIIISSDNNLLLKAKENNLNFKRIPDKYLLKEELSDEEKEIKNLKAEIEKYKNRQPKISIMLDSGAAKMVFKKPKERDLEKELSIYMEQLKKQNPYLQNKEMDLYKTLGFSLYNSHLTQIYTQEQIGKYNTELDDFFKETEAYKRFLLQQEILNERFKEISFHVLNDGTAQTGDMNIFIEFPENIKLYNRKCKTSRDGIAPIKSELPPYGMDRKILYSIEFNKHIAPFGRGGIPQIYCWDINETIDDREFKFQHSNLNHKMVLTLNIEDSIYIDTGACDNFRIKWCVIDSKLIEPVHGILNIIIE